MQHHCPESSRPVRERKQGRCAQGFQVDREFWTDL